MTVNSKQIIKETTNFVKAYFQKEGTGHDWWHTSRVKDLGLKIASNEGGNLFIVEMSALLHDVGDYKFFNGDKQKGADIVAKFLNSLKLPSKTIDTILEIATNISYMKTLSRDKSFFQNRKSPEFMAVSDADRLDAIGAIGIARVFTYGGYYHRPIYEPDIPPNPDISQEEYKTTDAPSINHFYEKLLKLKNMMYTSYGKKLAHDRHQFLEKYLERFYAEWEGRA
jgi:uncharacterized protein